MMNKSKVRRWFHIGYNVPEIFMTIKFYKLHYKKKKHNCMIKASF